MAQKVLLYLFIISVGGRGAIGKERACTSATPYHDSNKNKRKNTKMKANKENMTNKEKKAYRKMTRDEKYAFDRIREIKSSQHGKAKKVLTKNPIIKKANK